MLGGDVSFDLWHAVAGMLANAQVPAFIVDALRASKLTALSEPNGRIGGISAGEVFRKLVAKTLAKQY